jgi:phospholipid/cholesterol/gamma-HCH transport system substrate-binding protein
MGRNVFETIMGAVVLLVASGFIYIAYQSGAVKATTNGYEVIAKFDRADGLALGTDVRVSGIKVGAVEAQKIDPQTYMAIVTMSVEGGIKLPEDSSAEIVGDGLLGGKYVAIVPGGAEKMIPAGGEIKFTQSSVSLEQLIGKMVFGGTDDEKNGDKTADAFNEEDVFGGI